MRRLEKALPKDFKRFFISTDAGHASQFPGGNYFHVPDASRTSKVGLLVCAAKVLACLLIIRPDVVITTGAAPGFFALFFARKLGKKTIWLDSIANVRELSLSGQKAGKYADLWLTQWPQVSSPNGPEYHGAIL